MPGTVLACLGIKGEQARWGTSLSLVGVEASQVRKGKITACKA